MKNLTAVALLLLSAFVVLGQPIQRNYYTTNVNPALPSGATNGIFTLNGFGTNTTLYNLNVASAATNWPGAANTAIRATNNTYNTQIPSSFTNGQTLWVSAGSNAPAVKGRQDLPWGSITGALAAATSGDTIKLRPFEVFSMGTGQIRLPDNVNLDYSQAVILSGGARLQDGIFLNPGNNSVIYGYGGIIGCTNDSNDEFCPPWGAIGAIDAITDRAFTNVYIYGGRITNAPNDVFYVAQSIAENTNRFTMYVRDVEVLVEAGGARWDVIALGGDSTSAFDFENCVFEIFGHTNFLTSPSGGDTALLRWTSAGRLRLNNVRISSTNSYRPTTFITGVSAGLPPIEITGGDYRIAPDPFTGVYWYLTEGGALTSTNRVQWPPPNSVGYCTINGAFISFGSNTFGTYPATAADRLVFWDNSENGMAYATIGSGLTMTGTELSASGSGSVTLTNTTGLLGVVTTAGSGTAFGIGTNMIGDGVGFTNIPTILIEGTGINITTNNGAGGRFTYTIEATGGGSATNTFYVQQGSDEVWTNRYGGKQTAEAYELSDSTAARILVLRGQLQLDANIVPDDFCVGTVVTQYNAGATIGQWAAVYMGSGGEWLLADADGSGTYPATGLATTSANDNNPLNVIVSGVVLNDEWSWTVGGLVYLDTTAGGLTQTPPSEPAVTQVVGVAVESNKLLLSHFGLSSTSGSSGNTITNHGTDLDLGLPLVGDGGRGGYTTNALYLDSVDATTAVIGRVAFSTNLAGASVDFSKTWQTLNSYTNYTFTGVSNKDASGTNYNMWGCWFLNQSSSNITVTFSGSFTNRSSATNGWAGNVLTVGAGKRATFIVDHQESPASTNLQGAVQGL